MRIRTLAVVAVASALPFGLTACGGPGVEDFCEQYEAIGRAEVSDGAEIRNELEELADSVPDDAGGDVQQAADLLADDFPEDGDLARAVESGDVGEEEANEFAAAVDTIASYGDENCGS